MQELFSCSSDVVKVRKSLSQKLIDKNCLNLETLTYLDLSGRSIEAEIGRRISDGDIDDILTYLSENEEVKCLDLGYNNISGDGFMKLARYLVLDSNLVLLDLRYNEIKVVDKEIQHLAQDWSIESLILTGNKFGPEGWILGIIEWNQCLENLEIGDTDQTFQSAGKILQMLTYFCRESGSETLTRGLDLSRVLPTRPPEASVYSAQLCTHLSQVMSVHEFVSLKLSSNAIGDFELERLLDGLGRSPFLQRLDLSVNSITSHGAQLLARVLPSTNLIELSLSSNKIGDDGAIALGSVFHKTRIIFLDLSKNRITDEGLIYLINGLKNRPYDIETFFIYGNHITELGALELYTEIENGFLPRDSYDLEFRWNIDGSFRYFEDTALKNLRNLRALFCAMCDKQSWKWVTLLKDESILIKAKKIEALFQHHRISLPRLRPSAWFIHVINQ